MRDDCVAALLFPCHTATLVVLASWVEVIDDLSRVDGEVRDVLPLLGLEVAPRRAGEERRALRLRSGLWLAMSHEVLLRVMPVAAFGPVPAWLGRLADRAPVAAVVRLESGFGFEVDVARLAHGDGDGWA